MEAKQQFQGYMHSLISLEFIYLFCGHDMSFSIHLSIFRIDYGVNCMECQTQLMPKQFNSQKYSISVV